MKISSSPKVFVSESTIPNAGRGVFAASPIKKGGVIEICPVIRIPMDDSANDDDKGLLTNYFFYFDDALAVALGFGSIYNHSYTPNATYKKKPGDDVIEFVAIKDIPKNEEVTVNYNYGNPEDTSTPPNSDVPPKD